MSLPFITKPESKTSQRKYVFALEISPSTIKGAIWTVVNDKTQVVAVSSPIHWDDKTEDSLITACDQVLSDATSRLDASGKIEVEEVIFGLCSDWVDIDKVKLSKLAWLKSLSTKLELKPVGFVITVEAITKYLHHGEGVPPSAILLGFWPRDLEVTVVRMGKTDGIHLVRRSSNLAEDVVEGLSRYQNADMMPSRMLLYDSGLDLEEVKQALLAHPWQAPNKKLPFLHFPKIEVLPGDFTVRAVALAGGEEVARAIGMLEEEVVVDAQATVGPVEEVEVPTEDMGFVENVDVSTRPTHRMSHSDLVIHPEPSKPKLKISWPRVSWDGLKIPQFPKFKFGALGISIGVVVILLLLGMGYWYLPTATVILSVTPKNFSTQFSITVDKNLTQIDSALPAVPGQVLETTVSAEEKVAATGSKLIGDKATGSVVISNALDASRSFPAGTILTSPSGLRFVLDEGVVVASASGSAGNLNPGKATVKVTAGQIGSESNLSAGTVFRVASLAVTQVDAKNDVALSGGTSRQAKAVAKADITTLTDKLSTVLKEQAQQQLLAQVSDDKTVISESITQATNNQQFTAKEGDEADEVGLKMTVKASGWVVSKADLEAVVAAKIGPETPEGYSAVSEASQSFKLKSSKVDSVVLDANVSAQLLPELDENQIASTIRGKAPKTAQEYLQSLPGVEKIDFLLNPSFIPPFLVVIPRILSHINIDIQSSVNP